MTNTTNTVVVVEIANTSYSIEFVSCGNRFIPMVEGQPLVQGPPRNPESVSPLAGRIARFTTADARSATKVARGLRSGKYSPVAASSVFTKSGAPRRGVLDHQVVKGAALVALGVQRTETRKAQIEEASARRETVKATKEAKTKTKATKAPVPPTEAATGPTFEILVSIALAAMQSEDEKIRAAGFAKAQSLGLL